MVNDPTTRRRFLGASGGAVLALPWLESLAGAAPAAKPATRLAIFYLPNGLVRRGFFPGEGDRALPKFSSQNNVWRFEGKTAPVGSHPLTFTPTMKSLHPVRDKIALLTGLDRTYQHGTDVHAQAGSCFLTSSAPYTVKGSAYPISRTLDHVAGEHVGKETPFKTLELSCNNSRDNIESIYFDNMSWYDTGHVAPSMRNPRTVYDRLFNTGSSGRHRTITDLALGNARSLKPRLGGSDRRKLDEYFESVRAIERRMDRIESMKAELAANRVPRPAERLPRNEYIHLMGDLMITALQTGLTNVTTFMISAERWGTPVTYDGVLDKPANHHSMTHNQAKHVDELLKLDAFHVSVFASMVAKMDAIREADGTSLLDNTLFTMGAGLGDGGTHQYNDLPIVIAGGRSVGVKTGRHIQFARKTPLANLWLTWLQLLGVKREQYADSTGTLGNLLA